MRADHPGSYLHLSQPLRLDARPCTYMWPRKSHDAVPGQAAKVVQPSKSEWTHIKKPVTPGPCDYLSYNSLQHFEHGVGGGKSYGPPIVHARPARGPKECRNAPRLSSRRLSDGSLSAASTTFRPSTPTTSTMKK